MKSNTEFNHLSCSILLFSLAFLVFSINAISETPKFAGKYEISSGGIDVEQPDLTYVFHDSIAIVKFRNDVVYTGPDKSHVFRSIDSIFPILKSRQDKKLDCIVLDAGYTRIIHRDYVIHNTINIASCDNVDSLLRIKLFRGMHPFYNFQSAFEKSNKRLCDSLWLAGKYIEQFGGIYGFNPGDTCMDKYRKVTLDWINSKKKTFDSTWKTEFPSQLFLNK